MEFTITIDEKELNDLALGIMEMPAKKANPLMQKIQKQINDQIEANKTALMENPE